MMVINEGMLAIPVEWKDESINMFTTGKDGAPGLSFTISRDTLPWGMTFADFANKEIDALASSLKGFDEVVRKPIALDGREALLAEFRWQSAQGPIHQCMVVTAADQRVLVFTASNQGSLTQQQKQRVLEVIGTFRFRPIERKVA